MENATYVRKRDGESWNDKRFIREEAKFHGGLQVMVWGIINKQGGVKLVWVNRMKNGALNSK